MGDVRPDGEQGPQACQGRAAGASVRDPHPIRARPGFSARRAAPSFREPEAWFEALKGGIGNAEEGHVRRREGRLLIRAHGALPGGTASGRAVCPATWSFLGTFGPLGRVKWTGLGGPGPRLGPAE